MKCLILAAGYATRLYPLTENFPKPLLEVGGKTILDYLVEDVAPYADGFAVVTNHKFAEHFRRWAAARAEKIEVVDDGTSTNETRLGAVADVQFALDALRWDDDLLVMAGDNLLDFSLASFIEYARCKSASCVMRFKEPDPARLRKCGVLLTGPDDRILEMEEKPAEPKSNWVCPPFYWYSREDARLVRKALDEGCGRDAPGSFIAWLAQVRPVYAMPMAGHRYDIGTLESYRSICELWETGLK